MIIENSKQYNLVFDQRAEYLHAYVSGDTDSLDISQQYWREIADECRRLKCSKLLIVEDINDVFSMMEMYQIASEIPNMGFLGVRIAFVDQYLEQQTVNEFGEIVATNRGVHGKVFNDIAEAEKWLLA